MQYHFSLAISFLLGLSLISGIHGFTTTTSTNILKPSMMDRYSKTSSLRLATTSLNLNANPASFFAGNADVTDALMKVGSSAQLIADGDGGIIDIVKNIAVAITAVLFLGAGLTVVTASIIVPAAAKELEQECKELAPDMWEEYQAKLEEGQTMANRPDLMQELGAKLQPLLDAKMAKQFAQAKAEGKDVSKDEEAWNALDKVAVQIPTKEDLDKTFDTFTAKPDSSNTPPPAVIADQWGDDNIVDAEVIKKTDESK